MCTILAWLGEHPRYPLIIAANRDEYEDRASSGPQVLSETPLVVGGRDDLAGGTWLAISERGFICAVANRKGAGAHDPSKRSRGALVFELARAQNVAGARLLIESHDARSYNPFILAAADAQGGFAAHGGARGLDVALLNRGAHAITNWDLDSDVAPKAVRAKSIARSFDPSRSGDPDELARRLHEILRDHAAGPGGLGGGLCVHRPESRYGTRSAWIVMVSARPDESRAYYIEGHPCDSELSDVTHLLRGTISGGVKR